VAWAISRLLVPAPPTEAIRCSEAVSASTPVSPEWRLGGRGAVGDLVHPNAAGGRRLSSELVRVVFGCRVRREGPCGGRGQAQKDTGPLAKMRSNVEKGWPLLQVPFGLRGTTPVV
jgi:hypothetical protein